MSNLLPITNPKYFFLNYTIEKYNSKFFTIWNDFVEKSKNGTFLFHRDFMEYHQDRFDDFSLLIFKNETLLGILPANILDNEVHSHQGLTYGGLIVSAKLKTTEYIEIFKTILKYLHSLGIENLFVKEVPHFYFNQCSEEIKYLQFVLNAETYRKDVCSVINFQHEFVISKSVKRDLNISKSKGSNLDWNGSFELFWNEILVPNLQQKHQKKPVHNLDEILYLKSKFPDNIYQINIISADNKILGGTTLFVTNNVVHSQYIGVRNDVMKEGVLDLLYFQIIDRFKDDFSFFDFGISNENQGRNLNLGLLFWKEKFGARPVVQEFYKFKTNNFNDLENIYL